MVALIIYKILKEVHQDFTTGSISIIKSSPLLLDSTESTLLLLLLSLSLYLLFLLIYHYHYLIFQLNVKYFKYLESSHSAYFKEPHTYLSSSPHSSHCVGTISQQPLAPGSLSIPRKAANCSAARMSVTAQTRNTKHHPKPPSASNPHLFIHHLASDWLF